MENKIGSTWKKWNPHIHTDASDGKDPVKKYKMRLLAKYIKCIAVTDHHTVVNVDMITLAALQGCVIPLWCLLCTLLKKKNINVCNSYKLAAMISLVCHK